MLALHRTVDHLHSLVEIIAHDHFQLRDTEHEEHEGGDDLDGKDLDVELEQTDTALLIERLPRIKHGHAAAATEDLRRDRPSEGAVEGDDGLVFLGQHGGLHTLEGDVCGDDDEDEAADGDEDDEDELHEREFLHRAWVAAVALRVVKLHHHGDEEAAGDVQGGLLRDGADCGGEDDFLGCFDGGDAAVPALRAWGGDDGVGPGHLEGAETDRCEDGDEGMVERGRVGGEHLDDGGVEEGIDHCDMEAAETGPWTGDGAEVFEGCTQLRGDGRLFDKEEVGLQSLEGRLLGFLVLSEKGRIDFGVLVVGGRGLEGCGGRTLDHRQGRHDVVVGIGNLAERRISGSIVDEGDGMELTAAMTAM